MKGAIKWLIIIGLILATGIWTAAFVMRQGTKDLCTSCYTKETAPEPCQKFFK